MSGRRAVWFCTILLLFITAFSAVATSADDPALARGISAYEDGDSQEALSQLRGFVIRNFQDPQLPTAYLYLARIFLEEGSHKEALLYTGRIPDEKKSAEALLVEGLALAASGQQESAVARLLKSNPGQLQPADGLRRATALAEIQSSRGQHLEALAVIQRQGDGRDPSLLALAHDILSERISNGDLNEAVFMFQGTPLGLDARTQQATRALQQGLAEQAQLLLAKVLQSPVAFPYRNEAEALWNKLGGGDPATFADRSPAPPPVPASLPPTTPSQPFPERSLGVLLPLQGRHAPFAQLVRQGMEFAVEVHGQNYPGIRLLIRDSGANPEESTRAVNELAADPSVLAIAGPITGGAAAVCARQAQLLRIPLFALTPKTGIPDIGNFIFRHSLTSQAQVEALLSQAMERRGLTSFAVLYPESSQGKELAGLFVNSVMRRGGQIVASEGYKESLTDFRIPLRLLKGEDPNSHALPANDPPPFQALFIPDYPEKIRLIAPQLSYYGLQGVQLLGISGWKSPELLRSSGQFLQGAFFADGFYADADAANVRHFVDTYRARYGAAPSILEAQGYDVASLLLQLMTQPEVRDRESLRTALSQVTHFTGASRPFSIAANGDSQQSLWLLTIAEESFAEVP
ncbi:ABC transporter substrate-binding protein [Trichloromonas sp.]|uniref:penicillin-binding protein activator n=1 Tax=Trichloromonas sp. TaxID=3069249 RepID=UPI002A3989C8|nr:penicillin-binding protein activator [Trichloromonas sp.]